MHEAAPHPPRRRLPPEAAVRLALLLVIVAVGVVTYRWTPVGDYLTSGRLLDTLVALRSSATAPFVLIGLYVGLCPLGIPVSALMLAGGAAFGVALGSLYNIVGALLGAFVSYGIARLVGGKTLLRVLPPAPLERAERLIERYSFWALVRVRFLPIPFALVNYGAALAGVAWSRFLITTLLGLIPSTVLYTWAMATVVEAAAEQRVTMIRDLTLALLGLVLLSLSPSLLRARARRRKTDAMRRERSRAEESTRS